MNCHVVAGLDVGREVDALLASGRRSAGVALAGEVARDQDSTCSPRVGIRAAQAQQVGHFLAAGQAPGRPDVDQHRAWHRAPRTAREDLGGRGRLTVPPGGARAAGGPGHAEGDGRAQRGAQATGSGATHRTSKTPVEFGAVKTRGGRASRREVRALTIRSRGWGTNDHRGISGGCRAASRRPALLCAAAGARVADAGGRRRRRRRITRGPYIQNPQALPTSTTFEWWTNVAGDSTVEYGTHAGARLVA